MYSVFSFPVNLISFILWGILVLAMWRNRRESRLVKFLLSSGATHIAVGLFIVFCLVVGFTDHRWLTRTWPFIIFLLYFQTVLACVILRGWRIISADGSMKIRWRFLFLHVGILTVTASSFWAAPDNMTLRMRAVMDMPVAEAYNEDGRTHWLKYEIELKGFDVDYDDTGMPSDYSANVLVAGKPVTLRVNHPYSVTPAETVYLTGYDENAGTYCILQIVREPCRWVTLAGIVMMLAGAFLLFINGPHKRKESSL